MARTESTPTPAGKGTRPRKSAAEKAQIELDAATKHRDTIATKLEKAKPAVVALEAELQQANQLVDYLAKNPLLPQPVAEGETPADDSTATLTATNGEQSDA